MIDERAAIEKSDDPSVEKATQSSDSQYKVGPGYPPLESQFKKGAPSPNPKGRPRKNPSIAPDMKKALEEALNKKVKVKKGDTQVSLSMANLGIDQLVHQFAKGDRYARRDVMDMAKELGVDLLAGQKRENRGSIVAQPSSHPRQFHLALPPRESCGAAPKGYRTARTARRNRTQSPVSGKSHKTT